MRVRQSRAFTTVIGVRPLGFHSALSHSPAPTAADTSFGSSPPHLPVRRGKSPSSVIISAQRAPLPPPSASPPPPLGAALPRPTASSGGRPRRSRGRWPSGSSGCRPAGSGCDGAAHNTAHIMRGFPTLPATQGSARFAQLFLEERGRQSAGPPAHLAVDYEGGPEGPIGAQLRGGPFDERSVGKNDVRGVSGGRRGLRLDVRACGGGARRGSSSSRRPRRRRSVEASGRGTGDSPRADAPPATLGGSLRASAAPARPLCSAPIGQAFWTAWQKATWRFGERRTTLVITSCLGSPGAGAVSKPSAAIVAAMRWLPLTACAGRARGGRVRGEFGEEGTQTWPSEKRQEREGWARQEGRAPRRPCPDRGKAPA